MKKNILFCWMGLLLSLNVFSWGAEGHKIVATIAKKCLTKQVLDSVNYYLNGMSFKEASVWMDEVRKEASYDYLKPWHYINIDKDKTYVAVNEPNVVNQLELAIATLKLKGNDRTKDKISFALKIIFHLVGDLHQPLHDGYSNDKGGNTISVSFNGGESNLHKVWDTGIIENQGVTTKKCLKYINTLSEKEKFDIQTVNVQKWMEESRSLLPNVYAFQNNKITKDYEKNSVPLIKQQLSKAGIRLACILFNNFNRK
ncbi:MAG: S1/P1 nuclease [Bacteroidota bacterium]|nr:S1/P1 nuclease [Bacteroidota bacterium]